MPFDSLPPDEEDPKPRIPTCAAGVGLLPGMLIIASGLVTVGIAVAVMHYWWGWR